MKTLTLITKTGIVNHYNIQDDNKGNDGNFIQLIWKNKLSYTVLNMNPHQEDEDLKNVKVETEIGKFQAIFLNDILLVKNGKLASTPFWKFWREY
jgi:hypothetical protein